MILLLRDPCELGLGMYRQFGSGLVSLVPGKLSFGKATFEVQIDA